MSDNKRKKRPSLINTFFRNALKSNLDLTSLADTKASILISINGFILTVSVTASSFTVHSQMMTYAFIAIILTSLGSIILAVLAVQPRDKNKLVSKNNATEYKSLLYYQDAADISPECYKEQMSEVLNSKKLSEENMTLHLHMLASEIKKKYFWLKRAYAFFSFGLILSAAIIVLALTQQETPKEESSLISQGTFYNIFEPSGATTLTENKILLVEDEKEAKPFKMVIFDKNNRVVEIGSIHIPKKIKKVLKKKVEDLEGLTLDGNRLYAITSHSLTRANEKKKSRQRLLLMHYEDESITKLSFYNTLKEDLISTYPQIFGNTILGYSQLNIEALTTDHSALIIGFRAPLHNAQAMFLTLYEPKKLFQTHNFKELQKELHFIDLHGLGIRAMVYDPQKEGYWIVAGSSEKRFFEFELVFYDKKTKRTKFYKNFSIGRAEGISIVKNGSKRFLFLAEDNGEKPNKPATYISIDMEKL